VAQPFNRRSQNKVGAPPLPQENSRIDPADEMRQGWGTRQTQPSGSTLNNLAGRLMEAETDNCTFPITAITDEWFSYDPDGNVTDIWELTPHSTQYYHSTAVYAANGEVTSLALASPSIATETYGLDGEGRWNSLGKNRGQTERSPVFEL
jgi:hypothetical protein